MAGISAEVVIANELSYINETLQRIAVLIECNMETKPNNEIIGVLRDITDYAARNTCLHEETYRGGVLWEICSQCGMKWADDEGGKPDDAHELPLPIARAYDVLSRNELGTKNPDSKC